MNFCVRYSSSVFHQLSLQYIISCGHLNTVRMISGCFMKTNTTKMLLEGCFLPQIAGAIVSNYIVIKVCTMWKMLWQ